MRAEMQVIIIGYIDDEYLVLERADQSMWQFVSGGGEDDETPKEAAIREFYEETGIAVDHMIQLDSTTSIPSDIFIEHRDKQGLYVVPEYAFATALKDKEVTLSEEHHTYKFLKYETCLDLLKHDSNKTALNELKRRLKRNDL